ncbi:uncharacterized protein LOC125225086 isoform X2 [Leguminivora glycinivorella]|uniref:uncharacterized protein LOC125225086 isoform X2 n=1 Tax=Leguminivora glycinivorella TaxID=1035111 RepID=UPI00200C6B3A|nr:uncharacterized protein LOC125225086 isoform X2 [Leguminivora glycinivorella]
MPWGWECRAKLVKQLPAKPTQRRGTADTTAPGPQQYEVPELYGGKGYDHIKRAPAYSFGLAIPASVAKPAVGPNARVFNIRGFTKKGNPPPIPLAMQQEISLLLTFPDPGHTIQTSNTLKRSYRPTLSAIRSDLHRLRTPLHPTTTARKSSCCRRDRLRHLHSAFATRRTWESCRHNSNPPNWTSLSIQERRISKHTINIPSRLQSETYGHSRELMELRPFALVAA